MTMIMMMKMRIFLGWFAVPMKESLRAATVYAKRALEVFHNGFEVYGRHLVRVPRKGSATLTRLDFPKLKSSVS